VLRRDRVTKLWPGSLYGIARIGISRVRMAKNLPELKALIVDIEKVQ
jgi:hypothetical protein